MYIGIDTSAYTTSIAVVDPDKNIIHDGRSLVDIPNGDRGLAQSEALFKHIQGLPGLIAQIPQPVWKAVKGIGVSTRPRPVTGSYMPVFTSGKTIASALASALNIPLFETSHQEGHLAAGEASAAGLSAPEFLAVHISGGTTEVLRVSKPSPGQYDVTILGGSTDLHAGQFIDRVGVRLGLPFPAGKELEKLALRSAPGSASLLPSSVKGYDMSFSGVESAAQRLIDDNKRPADIARAVEGCIVRTIAKVLEKAVTDTGLKQIMVVGGVSANAYIRSELAKKLHNNARLYWASTALSSDNAVGVALLAAEALQDKPIVTNDDK